MCQVSMAIMGLADIILDRISFGGVKEREEMYFD
jgi:hypothetical protein